MRPKAMRHPDPVRSRSGFSLIEVLIAMTMLAVAIVALADLFLLSIKKNAVAAEGTVISTAAHGKMEELLGLPWGDPKLTSGSDTVSMKIGKTTKRYARAWVVNDAIPESWCPEVNNAQSCEMTVTVTVKGVDLGPMGSTSGTRRRGYLGTQQVVIISAIKVAPVGGKVELN